MVVKFSKTGSFLGCSRYPECKATRPMDGSARPAAVETEHKCPKCGKSLMLRESKRGPFLSCSGYPSCKESFNLDPVTNLPVPSVVETEHVCDKCGKPMALRQGSRGAFLGCTGYPKCRNTMPVDDAGKPVVPVKVDVKCEKCGGPMGVKSRPPGGVPRLLELPQVPEHRADPRRPQGAARRGRHRPGGGERPRPQDDRPGPRSATTAAAR